LSLESVPKVVLCADDDENLLRMMRLYLESYGYEVLTESSGRATLQTAATAGTLHALVLDYVMPDLSGGEVCSTLKQSKPELPIIMFSGSCQAIPGRVLNGVDMVLSKDEGMPALLAALDRLSARPRIQLPD